MMLRLFHLTFYFCPLRLMRRGRNKMPVQVVLIRDDMLRLSLGLVAWTSSGRHLLSLARVLGFYALIGCLNIKYI